MGKLIDLTGMRFGRLTVVERHGTNNSGKPTWICQCDCGNTAIVSSGELRGGNTKSCGCLRRESESKAVFRDLSGLRFGHLVVIERAGSTNAKKAIWKCQCDCGNISFVPTGSLKSGKTQSCGCYGYEMRLKANTTHGGKRERLYRIWAGMKSRCYIESATGYKHYGGRGITVCDEWKDNYENFRKWALENGYSDGLTIERIDVNGNYEPSNCKWIAPEAQTRNTRHNVFITINGETKILTDWARIYNIPYKVVSTRLRKGISTDHLFDPPETKK